MVKQAFIERRNAVRAKRVLSIEYRLVKSRKRLIDKTWGLSTTQDMSIEGLAFYADREFCVSDVLEIRVTMSGVLDIFNGFCRVVRTYQKKNAAFYFIAVKLLETYPVKRRAKSYTNSSKTTQKSRKRI